MQELYVYWPSTFNVHSLCLLVVASILVKKGKCMGAFARRPFADYSGGWQSACCPTAVCLWLCAQHRACPFARRLSESSETKCRGLRMAQPCKESQKSRSSGSVEWSHEVILCRHP